jgi:hypothetical protein
MLSKKIESRVCSSHKEAQKKASHKKAQKAQRRIFIEAVG